jgi:outer membrane protein OmpA-like peptidoglycan-associated protein
MFVSIVAKAQTGNVTGITINMEGTLMYYTAEKSGEHALYKAVKNASGTWDAGVSEDSFNEHIKGYVAKTPFLTCDGQTLYFSANLPASRGFDIFYSRKNGDSWSKPIALSQVINSEKDEISPSLPAGNLTIYFARNGLDNDCYSIYTSEVDISGWSVPKVLPSPISVGCEQYVYISPVGETLLFSTDRRSEKKKKKYNIYYSTLTGKNIWTAPAPIDNTVKEYNEFTPTIDHQNSKIFVARCGIDSATCSIYSYNAPVYKPYTLIKGIVRDEKNKPIDAEITIRDAYTHELYGKSNSNPATGEYTIVLPNNSLYNINYAVKNGSQLFESINTVDNTQGQTIVKDVVLFDKIVVNVTVQDAFSDKLIDAEVEAYEKTKTAKVSRLGEGKYQIVIPIFENVDIELYKENYIKENILVRFGDYATFPEMYYSVKLKPDMRSGVLNVKDILSEQSVKANVEVKNLSIDEEVSVSTVETGKYEFSIRKDCKYSISVTLKDYFYYYTVWKADASRIGQTLDVHLVPLNEINKIPIPNLSFPANESTLSPEASGELACIAKALKNNPEYTAIISLYHKDNEKERAIAQQRARSVITFMETSRIPKTSYKVEISPVDVVKISDISFVTNIPTDKK